jgi:hypothetical protein
MQDEELIISTLKPTLVYGSEALTIKKQDGKRPVASEMRLMRQTAGCTILDRKRKEHILEELQVVPITTYL